MVKINSEKQFTVTSDSLHIVLKEYGISDFTFEVFEEGIANTSSKIITPAKSYVLRVYAQERKSPDLYKTG